MSYGPFRLDGEIQWAGLNAAGEFHKNFQAAVKGLPATMGIAVVDLTVPGSPQYAANLQHHIDKHVYSLAKIAPFFAAYLLRDRLRNQFKTDLSKTVAELIAKIEKEWKPAIAQIVRDRIAKPDFPNLHEIFDITGGSGRWSFEFRGSLNGAPKKDVDENWKMLQAIDNLHKGYIPKKWVDFMAFMPRLKLMVRMSDNMSTGAVTSQIGMAYLYGALKSEGLYDAKNRRGLWLSNTYGYDNKFMGFEGSGRGDLTAGATAFAVAEYYTRLFDDKKHLVSPESRKEMIEILQEQPMPGIGTGSRFTVWDPADPNDKGLPSGQVTHSKIGLWRDTGSTSEAAIVQYRLTVPGKGVKNIRYVAVALEDSKGQKMDKVIAAIDGYIRSVHSK